MRNQHVRIIFLILALLIAPEIGAQILAGAKKIPYIEVVDCINCREYLISLPQPKYPKLKTSDPRNINGKVGVQILINETGKVESASAVSGHPYFRPILEKASFDAVFRPLAGNDITRKRSAMLIYQIVFRLANEKIDTWLPIINDRASYLPAPERLENETCGEGRVEIEVLVDKMGNVINATPRLGPQDLFGSATKAARKARFQPLNDIPPIEYRGIVAYIYNSQPGCPVR